MGRARGTEGHADNAGDVDDDDDMVHSGVSGVSGVWGDDETAYGGAPACTGTRGGMGFGGDIDGGCWVLPAKAGVDKTAPGWYGVEGMGEGAGDGITYVGYGPWPLNRRWPRTHVVADGLRGDHEGRDILSVA